MLELTERQVIIIMDLLEEKIFMSENTNNVLEMSHENYTDELENIKLIFDNGLSSQT